MDSELISAGDVVAVGCENVQCDERKDILMAVSHYNELSNITNYLVECFGVDETEALQNTSVCSEEAFMVAEEEYQGAEYEGIIASFQHEEEVIEQVRLGNDFCCCCAFDHAYEKIHSRVVDGSDCQEEFDEWWNMAMVPYCCSTSSGTKTFISLSSGCLRNGGIPLT